MENGLNISRSITLVTHEPLLDEVLKCWYRCVKTLAPNGVVMSVPSVDDKGNPRSVALVRREEGDRNHYIIPLTRDLQDSEAEVIVQNFALEQPDIDFDVRTSAPLVDRLDQDATNVEVEDTAYEALCMAWAKRQHQQWYEERTAAGWRYGDQISIKDKTHPLLRPWEDLPDQFRKVDLDQPKELLKLLNDQGYVVITQAEMDALMKLMRSIAR